LSRIKQFPTLSNLFTDICPQITLIPT
jgi:hypothetical protein